MDPKLLDLMTGLLNDLVALGYKPDSPFWMDQGKRFESGQFALRCQIVTSLMMQQFVAVAVKHDADVSIVPQGHYQADVMFVKKTHAD